MNQNEIRLAVIERANGCCEYCQSPHDFSSDDFAVEHIIAKAQGGSDNLDNLALSCQGCNNHKYIKIKARDPLTQQIVPLFHPRQDEWDDHFEWSLDFLEVLGRTPTGRATIQALQLNRDEVLRVRRVLIPAGEHPPD